MIDGCCIGDSNTTLGHGFSEILIKTKCRCSLVYIVFLENSASINIIQKWFCVPDTKKTELDSTG